MTTSPHHRPVPRPPRCPSGVKLAVLVFGIACILIAALWWWNSRPAGATQEQPVNGPTPLTEQQRLSQVIAHFAALGEQLPPESLDWRVNARRSLYQQLLCNLAYHLDMTEDPAFDPTVIEACDAQWRWWPDQAQYCAPCQR